LNRADSEAASKTIEQHLSLQFAARLPSSGRLVVQAANEGRSLFVSDPHIRQDITRALATLVELVADRPRNAQRGGGLFARMLRRAV
jgi:Flp pilus assembly CpaE family ATPase